MTPRAYCVQYHESDWHFIQRITAELGIHSHFTHAPDRYVRVFADDQTVFPKLEPLAYQQDAVLVADEPVANHFSVRLQTRTRRDAGGPLADRQRGPLCRC